MKVVINLKLVKKYKIFTKLSLYGMLTCLVFGLLFAFTSITSNILFNFFASTVLIVACYTLLRINSWLSSRWGSNPRLDEKITSSLKGLPDDYVIYHYVTDVPHVLIGPNGIFLLEVFENTGKVKFDKENQKWQYTKKGNFLSKFLFADNFSRPDKEIEYIQKDWRGFLSRLTKSNYFTPQASFPEPHPIIVFSDPNVELDTVGCPYLLVKLTKIKELIRGLPHIPQQEYSSLKEFQKVLPGADS
jgi:hypothetical protein